MDSSELGNPNGFTGIRFTTPHPPSMTMDVACTNSPTGAHCGHVYCGGWASSTPPPVLCCHCGQDVRLAGHGDKLPAGY